MREDSNYVLICCKVEDLLLTYNICAWCSFELCGVGASDYVVEYIFLNKLFRMVSFILDPNYFNKNLYIGLIYVQIKGAMDHRFSNVHWLKLKRPPQLTLH